MPPPVHSVHAFAAGNLLAHIVAAAFLVPASEIAAPTRGEARVALARQIAMYLAHVSLGFNYARAGRIFGRDRTTASYACRLVEERRDDPGFDAGIDHLERALRARLAPPRRAQAA